MAAKLALINVPADNTKNGANFYAQLLGIEPARSLTDQVENYHAPISIDGIYLAIQARFSANETVTAYFAVDDLTKAVKAAVAAGGKQIGGLYNLTITAAARNDYQTLFTEQFGAAAGAVSDSLGTAAVITDPDGNRLGLIQLEPHAQVFYKTGAHANPANLPVLSNHERWITLGTQLVNRGQLTS